MKRVNIVDGKCEERFLASVRNQREGTVLLFISTSVVLNQFQFMISKKKGFSEIVIMLPPPG